MLNANQLNHGGQIYNIDDVIKGQSQWQMYDPFQQMALQPDIRMNANGKLAAVLPFSETGIEGLMAQLQAMLGSDKKKVNARHFYHAEYTSTGTYAFAVNKAAGSVGAGGATVTTKISRFSLSQSGLVGKPLEGYKCFVKENNMQNVTVQTVQDLASGDFNITLRPINGEVLDLTRRSQYTLILSPLRTYDINATDAIRPDGVVSEFPALYDSWVQKYERRIGINEDEIDNYIYDRNFRIAKGLTNDGKEIEYWYSPQIMALCEEFIKANRILKTLFNRRQFDPISVGSVANVQGEEFDGLIPTIKKYGNFNIAYDSFMGASFKSLLFAMIKSIRKMNGSNQYMLLHDFNFGIDWSEAIASLIRNSNQSFNFDLFGNGGSGTFANFEYFKFKDFSWGDFKFRASQIDMYDSNKFGRPLENFAALMPAKAAKDTEGNLVPPVSYVNIGGAEMAKDQEVWIDDARKRAERQLYVIVKDSFGVEFNMASQMGIIQKVA